MTDDQIIAKQQREIENLKELNEEYVDTLSGIVSRMYAIGGPLNDNNLKFDDVQRCFLRKIAQEVEGVLPPSIED